MTASASTPSPGRIALYGDAPAPEKDYWMDVPEVAKALGIGKSTIYDAIKAGTCELRTLRFGRRIRVCRMDVEHKAGRSL